MDALPKSLTATPSTVDSDNEFEELCGQSSRDDTEYSAIAGVPISDNDYDVPVAVLLRKAIRSGKSNEDKNGFNNPRASSPVQILDFFSNPTGQNSMCPKSRANCNSFRNKYRNTPLGIFEMYITELLLT